MWMFYGNSIHSVGYLSIYPYIRVGCPPSEPVTAGIIFTFTENLAPLTEIRGQLDSSISCYWNAGSRLMAPFLCYRNSGGGGVGSHLLLLLLKPQGKLITAITPVHWKPRVKLVKDGLLLLLPKPRGDLTTAVHPFVKTSTKLYNSLYQPYKFARLTGEQRSPVKSNFLFLQGIKLLVLGAS